MRMNQFLSELCTWLDRDRMSRKILFAGSVPAGNRLLRMAACAGTPAVNTQAFSVRAYMEALAEPLLAENDLKRIDAVTAAVALQSVMMDYGAGHFTTLGRVELQTAQYMLPQLEELENCLIQPERLEETGEMLLANVWRKYLEWKNANGYVSARQLSEFAEPQEGYSYAILTDTPLTAVEQEFLNKIPSAQITRIHLAVPDETDLPRRSALLREGPFVSVTEKLASVPCVRCQEIGSEVRHAFQNLLENGIAAEDTVFLCPDQDYGMRVEEEGKLLGIKVDSVFGHPAGMTRTAQLIECLLDWAKRNYDTEALTPALISNCFSIQNEKKETVVSSRRMLYLFRKKAVGWGAERWRQLAASSDSQCAQAGQLMYAWVGYFEKPASPAREVGAMLFSLLASCMKRGSENELFLRVTDEISRIYPEAMTGSEYLERVHEIIIALNVESRATEKPGRVFCCSYSDALYVNRTHFILLGMSWDAFDKLSDEFPLLHDSEKESLSPLLHLAGDRAIENRYAVKSLLANREDAVILFSRAEMNHVGGQSILEASVYGDASRKYKVRNDETEEWEDHTPRVTILGRKALSESDLFLRAGIGEPDRDVELDEGREELWRQSFENRNWSATRLETALSCPRRFTLQVQMGLNKEDPGPLEQYGQGWLSATDRGNLIHKVLEDYFARTLPRRDAVDDDLLQSLMDRTISEWEILVPVPKNLQGSEALRAEKEKMKEIARQEIELHVTDPYRETVSTESPFGMDGEDFCLTFGDHTVRLNGRIDRVDRVGDHYEIIDYKTGNAFSFENKLDRKLQYYLYTLAWEKKHPDQPVTLARYDLLDGAGGIIVFQVEMTEQKRREMYDRVTDLLDTLSDPVTALKPEYKIYPPEGDDPCDRYCPFKDICFGAAAAELGYPLNDEETDDEEA